MHKWIDIDGERVAVKKGFDGWRIVHPYRDENGKVNTVNLLFGGKGNLVALIVMLFIVALGVYGYAETFQNCRHLASNPCDYVCCPDCDKINYTGLNSLVIESFSLKNIDNFSG